jgi:hypothetical protein
LQYKQSTAQQDEYQEQKADFKQQVSFYLVPGSSELRACVVLLLAGLFKDTPLLLEGSAALTKAHKWITRRVPHEKHLSAYTASRATALLHEGQ